MQRERFFKDFMFRERHLNDKFGSFIKLFSCYFIFLRAGCKTDLIQIPFFLYNIFYFLK
jgi:hypothetical protein